jgi:hypothetical protein
VVPDEVMIMHEPDTNRESALYTFRIATQCGDHPNNAIDESALGDVVYYGDNGQDEFASAAVFKAARGKGYIVAVESSDYTGHGCQCSGSAERFDSLSNALRLGLSPEEAELCGATKARTRAIERFMQESQ